MLLFIKFKLPVFMGHCVTGASVSVMKGLRVAVKATRGSEKGICSDAHSISGPSGSASAGECCLLLKDPSGTFACEADMRVHCHL